MRMLVLAAGLVLILIASHFGEARLLAFSIVTVVAALARLGGVPVWLIAFFWAWLNLVFLTVSASPLEPDAEEGLLLGLPRPAFWMLFGVWIVPILIWPLAFLFRFKGWVKE